MGVSRYSRDSIERRKQQAFDHLQWRCNLPYDCYDSTVPSIEELTGAGVKTARWQCRGCWHASASFQLDRFGRKAKVNHLRRNYVCGECGTRRPKMTLEYG